MQFLDNIPWGYLILACLTLGLAPFNPPHLFEKIQMLSAGELNKVIDWFDLLLHGTPWLLLFAKAGKYFIK